jgi:hypothetical protein
MLNEQAQPKRLPNINFESVDEHKSIQNGGVKALFWVPTKRPFDEHCFNTGFLRGSVSNRPVAVGHDRQLTDCSIHCPSEVVPSGPLSAQCGYRSGTSVRISALSGTDPFRSATRHFCKSGMPRLESFEFWPGKNARAQIPVIPVSR